MWSSDWRRRLRRAGLVAGGLALALQLSGCGFHPLYGQPEGAALSPAEQMAAVRIAPLPDRVGQQLHNMLRDRLNPRGQPGTPTYELRLSLTESRQELSIRKDETATRANLIIAAQFVLQEIATNQVVLRGQARSTNSYNILTSQFATTNAELNARKRGLREVSEDIRTRLGIYFAGLASSSS
ncbi:MAG TPA: LPS assembly lipoprotein LptE [Kiloniellales bacterium]